MRRKRKYIGRFLIIVLVTVIFSSTHAFGGFWIFESQAEKKAKEMEEKRKTSPDWLREDCDLLQSFFDTIAPSESQEDLEDRADKCGLYTYSYNLHEYGDKGLQISMSPKGVMSGSF